MRFGLVAAAIVAAGVSVPAEAVFLYIQADVKGTRQDFIACDPATATVPCNSTFLDFRVSPFAATIAYSGNFDFIDGTSVFQVGDQRTRSFVGTITMQGSQYAGTNFFYGENNVSVPVPQVGDFLISASAPTFYAGVTPPVPEPATWAMMLAGFSVMGFAMRRRRKVTTRVQFTPARAM